MAPAQNTISTKHVAVIGAGPAGLITSRELRREGHSVVVFEQEKQVGGLWVYTPKSESDPLSVDPTRSRVHSSIYDSLRTNVPRESMGVRDFPFLPRFDDESRDPRRYPNHREVLAYVQEFAREFKLEEMIRFETEVVRVEPVDGKWRVRSKNPEGVFEVFRFESCCIPEIKIGRICSFLSLVEVYIICCGSLRELTFLMFAPNLRFLHVQDTKDLEDIIKEEKACEVEESGIVPFQKLNDLHLRNLPKLKNIYWSPLPFPCLEKIDVRNCPNLNSIPKEASRVKMD